MPFIQLSACTLGRLDPEHWREEGTCLCRFPVYDPWAWAADWAAAVSARDDLLCRRCGAFTRWNQAHHIVKLQTICQSVEEAILAERLDPTRSILKARIRDDETFRLLANGVTLCKPCHAAAEFGHISETAVRALVPTDPALPRFYDEPGAIARIQAWAEGQAARRRSDQNV
jgi:hypothetical protein